MRGFGTMMRHGTGMKKEVNKWWTRMMRPTRSIGKNRMVPKVKKEGQLVPPPRVRNKVVPPPMRMDGKLVYPKRMPSGKGQASRGSHI